MFSSQALWEEDQIIKLEASCMWILGCDKTLLSLGYYHRLAGTFVILRMLVAILLTFRVRLTHFCQLLRLW